MNDPKQTNNCKICNTEKIYYCENDTCWCNPERGGCEAEGCINSVWWNFPRCKTHHRIWVGMAQSKKIKKHVKENKKNLMITI